MSHQWHSPCSIATWNLHDCSRVVTPDADLAATSRAAVVARNPPPRGDVRPSLSWPDTLFDETGSSLWIRSGGVRRLLGQGLSPRLIRPSSRPERSTCANRRHP